MNAPAKIATATLITVGIITAVVEWQRKAPQPTATVHAAEKPEVPPDVVVVDEKQLQQISTDTVKELSVAVERKATGKVSFNEDHLTPVFTPYAGRVIELRANKGDDVRVDQPLVMLESPDFVAVQNDLASARSDVAKAKIGVEASQVAAERAHRLYDLEAVSTKDVQQAEVDLARAQDEVRRAQAALSSVENRLFLFGKDPKEVADLEGHVDRQVVLRAPIAGTIVERKVGGGQYVKPDSPDPLFVISDLTVVWVLVDVYESDLAGIHLGTAVDVSVAAYPGKTFPARISFISPSVDPTTRTVRVRCLVPNPNRVLKPDMFATINISSAVQQSSPTVPASAVVVDGNDTLAFVVESPGRFRRRLIKLGREIDGGFVVDSGLRIGEVVATRGALLLGEFSKSK